MNLTGRDFLKLLDFTSAEIGYMLDLAADLKEKKKKGILTRWHEGKNVALIFEKTSTRTRCSFEVAAHDLGMGTTYLDPSVSQIGKKESIADTARVLSGMYEGIEYRGFGQDIVEELAKYAKVPVWNGLTNEFHPTQMLADLLTIREHFGYLKNIRFTYCIKHKQSKYQNNLNNNRDIRKCKNFYATIHISVIGFGKFISHTAFYLRNKKISY